MENKDLAIREKELKNMKELFLNALRLAKTPIIISLFVTPIRFLLELAGLPEYAIFIIGLLWLTLVFSVYWGIKLFNKKRPYLLLLLSLIIFSPVSRLTVVAAWWVDTRWDIGTHYGLYFDNWTQTLLNHGVYGALVQIIPGFLLGSLTLAIMRYRKADTKQTNGKEN
jgi:Na+/H+-dicarboxylate symporter